MGKPYIWRLECLVIDDEAPNKIGAGSFNYKSLEEAKDHYFELRKQYQRSSKQARLTIYKMETIKTELVTP